MTAESSRRRTSTDHGALPLGSYHICDGLFRPDLDSSQGQDTSTALPDNGELVLEVRFNVLL